MATIQTAHLLGLLALFIVVSANHPAGYHGQQLREALHVNKRVFECRELGQSCSGLPNCCDEHVCYWREGYSAIREGECVICVERNLKCQKDANCCTGMQCDKEGWGHLDGHCREPREKGRVCYEHSQCESGKCSGSWYNTEGSCE